MSVIIAGKELKGAMLMALIKCDTKNCLNCGKEIIREQKHSHCWHLIKYCSHKCSHSYNYFNYRKVRRQRNQFLHSNPKTFCGWCGKEFLMHSRSSKYCSEKCRGHFRVYLCSEKTFLEGHTKTCNCCGKKFQAYRYDAETCSNDCTKKRSEKRRLRRLDAFYKMYVNGSKNRNIIFELSLDEFITIIKQPCHYCGDFSKRTYINDGVIMRCNGIDRVNNYEGYMIKNCVPCCSSCNFFKHSYSEKEFAENIIRCYSWAETFVKNKDMV